MLSASPDYVPALRANSRAYRNICSLFFSALAEYFERAHKPVLPLLLGRRGLALMLNGKPLQPDLLFRRKGPPFSFQDLYVFHDDLRCNKNTAFD
jgi:hypothetical protein